jgi:hypothetical protein
MNRRQAEGKVGKGYCCLASKGKSDAIIKVVVLAKESKKKKEEEEDEEE